MLWLKLVESLRGMKYSQDSQIWLHSTDEMTSHMLTIITVKMDMKLQKPMQLEWMKKETRQYQCTK